jgi:hypothetical protein
VRLEDVSAQLRPRGNWESVDLGFAMVRRHSGLLISAWMLTVVPLWLALLGLSHWMPLNYVLLIIWWLKPIYDRVPLFILSRTLFGAKPRLRDVLKAWPGMMVRNFLGLAILRVPWLMVLPRFAWARGLLLPVLDLEQQRGAGFRERQRVLLDRAGNAAGGLVMGCALFEMITMRGLLALVISIFSDPLNPGELYRYLKELTSRTAEMPAWMQWSMVASYLVAVTFVENLFVAGGFGLYLNCRTHLEGWDVEIAFRRLARRLGSQIAVLAAVGVLALGLGAGNATAAEAYPREREAIERVMKSEDFHIETREVPKKHFKEMESSRETHSAPGMAGLGEFFFWLIIAAGVVWIGWLIYKNWPLFSRRKSGPAAPATPRTVMGMEITPDSLPADLLGAARALWQAGDVRGALSLLYRGSVAWLVNVARLAVRESDTEGDCLRLAGTLPNEAAVGYFGDLTEAWIVTAYASHALPGDRMERLLTTWPFFGIAEGRKP